MKNNQDNPVLHNLGQDIFDVITAVESIAFMNDSRVLSEEFGSWSQTTNANQSEIVDSFKLKTMLAVITIHSAPNFPDDWAEDYKLEMKVNDSLVLKGRMIKEQHAQNEAIFVGLEAEIFVEGPWIAEVKDLAELYRNRLIEVQKAQDAEQQKNRDERIQRRLNQHK